MKLASFDIFDTTLIRRFGKPNAINLLINGNHSEGDEKERKVESENLTVNPEVANLIEKKRGEGFHIAFISDMYLDGKFLKDILQREGCYRDGDSVYISCDYNARKDTGTLYDFVRNDLKPEKWEHYGDNYNSDFKMAQRKGIDAYLYKSPFTEFEEKLAKSEAVPFSSLFAGLSRSGRMKTGNNAHSAIAADFVSAAYVPYIVKIRNWVSEQKVDKIYFLSRDSYVLMKGYETMIEDENKSIGIHYLFVSRRSLLLPYMHLAGTDFSAHYLSAMDHSSIKGSKVSSLLKALGTDEEELGSLGVKLSFTKIHNGQEEDLFLTQVLNGPYQTLLRERAATAYSLIVDYFKQEDLLNAANPALVDIGWLGTSRKMINAILEREVGKKAVFYYYGIRHDAIPESFGKFFHYLNPEELSTEATTLIENYYSASPYATTIGYKRNMEGRVDAVFPEKPVDSGKMVSKFNVDAVSYILNVLKKWGLIENEVALKQWSVFAMNEMLAQKVNIDLTPLTQSDDFDTQSFVRLLTTKEMVCYSLLGQHITAYDKASLRFSCKNSLLFGFLSDLHNISEFIRRKMYQLLVK
ncbi:MAG: hypothetical protein J5875_04070 [Paludibacteraceae bacterium]|nr:hypothetical protein [Paludibacteraceae bacterium]